MSNLEKYQNVFVEIFEIDPSELNEQFTFKQIEAWDSMTHLTLISELEDAFNVLFETDDILHFEGYENGIRILTRYGVEF